MKWLVMAVLFLTFAADAEAKKKKQAEPLDISQYAEHYTVRYAAMSESGYCALNLDDGIRLYTVTAGQGYRCWVWPLGTVVSGKFYWDINRHQAIQIVVDSNGGPVVTGTSPGSVAADPRCNTCMGVNYWVDQVTMK